MKKTLIILVVAALAINGAGCKKKTKPAKLDSKEVAMYRNTAMVKELAS